MNHLNDAELILYDEDMGLSRHVKQKIQTHLNSCEPCSKKLAALKNKLEIMKQENQMDCQDCFDNLLNFLDGKLNLVKTTFVEEHLQECSRCRNMYETLKDLDSSFNFSTIEKTVPVKSQKKIESVVNKTVIARKSKT